MSISKRIPLGEDPVWTDIQARPIVLEEHQQAQQEFPNPAPVLIEPLPQIIQPVAPVAGLPAERPRHPLGFLIGE